jgi:hypothetical protein
MPRTGIVTITWLAWDQLLMMTMSVMMLPMMMPADPQTPPLPWK